MTATSGPTSPRRFASYDRATSSWKTSGGTSASGSTSFSGRWPTWGMTRDGVSFELAKPEPPTAANASSSLLPTPEASDASGGRVASEMGGKRPSGAKRAVTLSTAVHHHLLPTPNASVAQDGEGFETWEARRQVALTKGYNGNGIGMPLTIAVQLLPTPTASDATGPGHAADGGRNLRTEVTLLPTPTAGDAKSSGSRNLAGSKAHAGVSLTDALVHGNSTTPRMLPTPTARDWKTGTSNLMGTNARPLNEVAVQWLPTPSDGETTPPESPAGNPFSDEVPPTPPKPEPAATDDSPPPSSNG